MRQKYFFKNKNTTLAKVLEDYFIKGLQLSINENN